MSDLQMIPDAMRDYWLSLAAEAPRQDDEQPEEAPYSDERCPYCLGMGFYTLAVPPGHAQFGKPQRCVNPDCTAAQENARRAIRNYELPKAYRELDFGTWQKRVQGTAWQGKQIAFAAAMLFASANPRQVNLADALDKANFERCEDSIKSSLAFYGPMGTGKTGLCAAIMNTMARAGETQITYRRTSDLFLDLQDAYGDKDRAGEADERSFAERLQKYQRTGVLILDEWRMERVTEARRQWMEDIIRYRHGHRLPTLITTNLTPDAIYTHWTEQTADVALEMAHWIEVGGEKLRLTMRGIRET